jgi:adenine phosphoribosyltransferase
MLGERLSRTHSKRVFSKRLKLFGKKYVYFMKIDKYKDKFSKDSIGRYDIAPVFLNYELFNSLIDDLSIPFLEKKINKIVCIDAIGFILGSAIAIKMKKGLVLIRKEGKIPLVQNNLLKRSFNDYSKSEKVLEINRHSLMPNENVLLVDDWIETGSQMKAVISMLEELKVNIIGITCIGIDKNEKTEELFNKYDVKALGINA